LENEAKAQEHIAIARPSMEFEKEYNRVCFESISGNADQAFALLETALEKGQIQVKPCSAATRTSILSAATVVLKRYLTKS